MASPIVLLSLKLAAPATSQALRRQLSMTAAAAITRASTVSSLRYSAASTGTGGGAGSVGGVSGRIRGFMSPSVSILNSSKLNPVSATTTTTATTTATAATPTPVCGLQRRHFADTRLFGAYKIYTKSAALTVTPRPPKFVSRTAQQSGTSYASLKTTGYWLLETAVSIPSNSNSGRSTYNWTDRLTFSLNINQLGQLLAAPHGETIKFTARNLVGGTPGDPNSSTQQYVTSTFVISRATGGTGYTFTFEKDHGDVAPIVVAVSEGEFAVIKSLAHHSIPLLVGWTHLALPIAELEESGGSGGAAH